MPHQVGKEFFRRKDDVGHDFNQEVKALQKEFADGFKVLRRLLKDRQDDDHGRDVQGRSRLNLEKIRPKFLMV